MAAKQTQAFTKIKHATAGDKYFPVPASCNLAIGSGIGDYLEQLHCVVTNNAAAGVTLTDGTNNAIQVLPTVTERGAHRVKLGLSSHNGAWRVVTSAGVSVIASGLFAA